MTELEAATLLDKNRFKLLLRYSLGLVPDEAMDMLYENAHQLCFNIEDAVANAELGYAQRISQN